MTKASLRLTGSKTASQQKTLFKMCALMSPALVLTALVCILHYRNSDGPIARATLSPAPPSFEPTIVNSTTPESAPVGMAWIPGGEFSMGANDPPDMDDVGMKATQDARPIHRVYVDGFFMDQTDVTNAQFTAFVKATGYIINSRRWASFPKPDA